MSATPTDLAPLSDRPAPSAGEGLCLQWEALQEIAGAVAAMAGLAPERPSPEIRDFPRTVGNAGGWRLHLASTGIADLSAMMTPGVKALLAVAEGGRDPTAPALALWREYHHARAGLLSLVQH